MNKQEIITQLCESCHNWVDQRELVWDLEEDRLVCIKCSLDKPKEWIQRQEARLLENLRIRINRRF